MVCKCLGHTTPTHLFGFLSILNFKLFYFNNVQSYQIIWSIHSLLNYRIFCHFKSDCIKARHLSTYWQLNGNSVKWQCQCSHNIYCALFLTSPSQSCSSSSSSSCQCFHLLYEWNDSVLQTSTWRLSVHPRLTSTFAQINLLNWFHHFQRNVLFQFRFFLFMVPLINSGSAKLDSSQTVDNMNVVNFIIITILPMGLDYGFPIAIVVSDPFSIGFVLLPFSFALSSYLCIPKILTICRFQLFELNDWP